MSRIKNLRIKQGLTQKDLAKESGLSLRTIQRIESENKRLKGHSLKALTEAFQVEQSYLLDPIDTAIEENEDDKLIVKFINLSTLCFLLIPFGNLLFPTIIWYKNRKSAMVDLNGRRMINFQILWTAILCFSLCLTPFIGIGKHWPIPLILVVLFSAMALNIIYVLFNAQAISKERYEDIKDSIISFL